MLLMPINPTMLQARDAILAADLMRFGGANQKEIWLGFARSGLGVGATARTAGSPRRTPIRCRTSGSGNGLRRHHVRDGELQGPRFRPASSSVTTRPGSRRSPTRMPRRRAPQPRRHGEFAPGRTTSSPRHPATGSSASAEADALSRTSGSDPDAARTGHRRAATARAPPVTPAATIPNLIDDTERTKWTAWRATAGNLSVDGSKVHGRPGGDRSRQRQVPAGQRDPLGRPEPLHGASAVRDVGVQQRRGALMTHTPPPDCSQDSGYKGVHEPGQRLPRRSAAACSTAMSSGSSTRGHEATHLRFVVKTSQCTGGPASRASRTQTRSHRRTATRACPRAALARSSRVGVPGLLGERQPSRFR